MLEGAAKPLELLDAVEVRENTSVEADIYAQVQSSRSIEVREDTCDEADESWQVQPRSEGRGA
jgi:hypothetical protein